MFVGLGNSSILGDSFGTKVLSRLIATNQYNDFLTIPKVALFTPETTAKTGISSFKLIEMVVGYLRPDVIVLVDSFITNQEKYLNMSKLEYSVIKSISYPSVLHIISHFRIA